MLFFTNDFLFCFPPNLWPNTFSPAIGIGKKGLTLGNTKDGFTNMTPVFYTPKQPEVKVNGTDSLHLTDSKYAIKKTIPAFDSVRYSSLNLKRISDSIVLEGVDLYKLEKLAKTSSDMINETKPNNLLFHDQVSYFEKDSMKVLYYTSDSSGTQIKYTVCLGEKDSITPANIKLIQENRIPSKKELELIEIKNEIRGFIQDSPSLNENKSVMNFDIPVLEKNNLFYFYLLPVSIESGQFYMGGDYIVTYSKDKKLLSIDPQHKGLIRVHKLNDTTIYSAAHTHLDDYSHFMTATDICQAKLYAKQTVGFSEFNVITTLFDSSFNTETNVLKFIKNKR
ncbi:MAG: hypothetical protein Q8904_09700 [Bacteroidota bacterium]|nr:hypothetical protein [Bacteroidota bacterium]